MLFGSALSDRQLKLKLLTETSNWSSNMMTQPNRPPQPPQANNFDPAYGHRRTSTRDSLPTMTDAASQPPPRLNTPPLPDSSPPPPPLPRPTSTDLHPYSPPSKFPTPLLPPSINHLHVNPSLPSVTSSARSFVSTVGIEAVDYFTLRTFVARLRQGIVVMKHPRGRLSKSTYRILHSIDNGRTLSWAAPSSSSPSKKFPRFNLVDCLSIRHGWTVDPSSPSQTGTLVLRRKCHASESFTSFSLVYEERTIDFTAVSPDQAVILLRGLNGLCFKLKEERFVREEVLSQAKERLGQVSVSARSSRSSIQLNNPAPTASHTHSTTHHSHSHHSHHSNSKITGEEISVRSPSIASSRSQLDSLNRRKGQNDSV
ncbi:hypothetical protein TrST_g14232 [Triparma strigata]|uniref:Uncharacterized protein n=2 Tax=Triparma strigata TaxID=1606541 RepID=A0A9W7AY04_9STRA|nr:hypothetical protein TrST_g14232 [Triparma strigata]